MSDLDEIKEKEAQAEELMENLRKLTPEQIRAFHHERYNGNGCQF